MSDEAADEKSCNSPLYWLLKTALPNVANHSGCAGNRMNTFIACQAVLHEQRLTS